MPSGDSFLSLPTSDQGTGRSPFIISDPVIDAWQRLADPVQTAQAGAREVVAGAVAEVGVAAGQWPQRYDAVTARHLAAMDQAFKDVNLSETGRQAAYAASTERWKADLYREAHGVDSFFAGSARKYNGASPLDSW